VTTSRLKRKRKASAWEEQAMLEGGYASLRDMWLALCPNGAPYGTKVRLALKFGVDPSTIRARATKAIGYPTYEGPQHREPEAAPVAVEAPTPPVTNIDEPEPARTEATRAKAPSTPPQQTLEDRLAMALLVEESKDTTELLERLRPRRIIYFKVIRPRTRRGQPLMYQTLVPLEQLTAAEVSRLRKRGKVTDREVSTWLDRQAKK
jgi:hypothetical protein